MLGERKAAVTRELTKLFEEVRRGSLAELAEAYAREPPPKGEVVDGDRRAPSKRKAA